MLRARAPLALLACTMAALVVAATHTPIGRCDGDGYPALGIVEATGGTADTTVYVDDRNFFFSNGLWVYAESNGVWSAKAMPGVFADDVADHDVQRGSQCGGPLAGASECQIPDDAEICSDDREVIPDLLVF